VLREELLNKMRLANATASDGTKSSEERAAAAAEFNTLMEDAKRMDTVAEMTARSKEAEKAQIPDAAVKEMADKELWVEFGKLLRGEQVSDVARDALQPRATIMRDKAGRDGFRAPGIGLQYLGGRAMQDVARNGEDYILSSENPGPLNLLQTRLAPMIQMPLPPTPFWDRATKISAINGIAYPILTQTSANPWAGVVISVGEESDLKIASVPPAIGTEKIVTHEYNAYTIITDLALRRAPTYESVVAEMFRGALASRLNLDGIGDGDGTTECEGVLTAVGVIDVPRAGAGEVSWADLVGLKYAAPWYWTVGANFMLSQTAQQYLESDLAVADGRPLFTASTANSIWDRLCGRPFNLDFCQTLGTRGDVIFGDPRWYTYAVEQDIVFRRTDQGLTLGKANSTAFFVFAHVGGQLLEPTVFSVLDDVATS